MSINLIQCTNIYYRAIGTLMTKLARVFAHQNNNKFIKILPMVTATYNNSVHRSIGTKPNLVNESNQSEIWRYLYRDLLEPKKKKSPRFVVGQKVRVSLAKQTFEKGAAHILIKS
jgi:hypothetical protein